MRAILYTVDALGVQKPIFNHHVLTIVANRYSKKQKQIFKIAVIKILQNILSDTFGYSGEYSKIERA